MCVGVCVGAGVGAGVSVGVGARDEGDDKGGDEVLFDELSSGVCRYARVFVFIGLVFRVCVWVLVLMLVRVRELRVIVVPLFLRSFRSSRASC
jgi:hypothetical protein